MSVTAAIVPVVVYLLVINAAAYLAFAIDKRAAREPGARRIPERTLLRLAAAGGSVGAVVAQQRLRHKSYKQPFRAYLMLIIVAQTLILAVLVVWQVFRF